MLIAGGSSAAAAVFNQQKTEIAHSRDTLKGKNETIAAQRDEYKGLYEAYRGSVDVFVNEAPAVLEGNPLAAASNAELLRLTAALLEDAQGRAGDRPVTGALGQLGVRMRQAEAALAKAQVNPAAGPDPKQLDEADRLFAEARTMAAALDQPGGPERDKVAGNHALMMNRQAAIRQLRRNGAADARASLTEAIDLNRAALAVQQRVLDAPESGETPPAEVRIWIGGTHLAMAQSYHFLGRSAAAPDEAKAAFLAEKEHARLAEEHVTAGLADAAVPPRVRTRAGLLLADAAVEAARAADRLDDLDAADAAYRRAADRMAKLVAGAATNLTYKQHYATVAAEYGDFLLTRRNDAAAARKVYVFSVFYLKPVAQPAELVRPLNNLALNYYRVATATLKAGDPKDAVRLYGLGLELREAQYRDAERLAASQKLTNPRFLVTARINLMLAQARVGRHTEAATVAQDLADTSPGDPRVLVQAAFGFALSSAAPGVDAGTKDKYLQQALFCLNRAIDNGYDDLTTLERDPDADPLRADDRFPGVLERLKVLRGKK